MISEANLFKLWKSTSWSSDITFEDFRKFYYGRGKSEQTVSEALLKEVSLAKERLMASAEPFDGECAALADAYEKLLFFTAEFNALKTDAQKLLDVLRAVLDWNAPLPPRTDIEQLGLACRQMSATLKNL